jgi:hypothetical protein
MRQSDTFSDCLWLLPLLTSGFEFDHCRSQSIKPCFQFCFFDLKRLDFRLI